MAITVTFTGSGGFAGTGGVNAVPKLRIYVFTNQNASPLGGTGDRANTQYSASVTVAATGSFVVGSMLAASATSFAALANSTIVDNISDATNNIRHGSFISTAVTAATGATVFGSSSTWATDGLTVAAEIKNNGSTLTRQTGSEPAVVSSTTLNAVTSASFTPAAGSIVVAVADGLCTGGSVTDSSSMTWTAAVQDGTNGYGGVFYAVVPSSTPGAVTLPTAALSLAAPAGTVTGSSSASVALPTAALALAAPVGTVSNGTTITNGKQLIGMFMGSPSNTRNLATNVGPNALLASFTYPFPSYTGSSPGPLTNIPIPGRGFYLLDGTSELTDIGSHWASGSSTVYAFNNNASNTGGIVPGGGLTIDGYFVAAGTYVFQFMNFNESFYFSSPAPNILFRGCRIRGPAAAPGMFNSESGGGGFSNDLNVHYCDLGGNGASLANCATVAIDVEVAANLRVLRNYISYVSTGIQPNAGSHCDVVENFIEKLTLADATWHLNGISVNGGNPNFLMLRNNIVAAATDELGNAITQTDCISMFQDFGTFPGTGTNSDGSTGYFVNSNYVGGTGYCFYLGQNAGTGPTTVEHLTFNNNLVTTSSYSTGGANGPLAAIPTFSGTYFNAESGNVWDDGVNAGTDIFGGGSVPATVALTTAALTLGAPPGTATGSSAAASVALPTAALSLTAPAGSASGGTAGLTVVHNWIIGADAKGYGGQYAKISNTTGNALVAFLQCGVDNPNVLPRFTIADDAHNWWIFAGTATTVFPGGNRRVDVWVCPNAKAATTVMVGASWVYSGFVGGVYEVAGFPQWVNVDFVATAGGFGTSGSVSGVANTADYVFSAVALSGSGSDTAITNPAGYSVLQPYNTFSLSSPGVFNDMRDEYLSPSYHAVTAGTVNPSWSWAGNSNWQAIAVGFKQSPTPPAVQVNSKRPALKVEAAFGYKPGQTAIAQTYPSWTDITSLVVDDEGSTDMKLARGRDYELTQPEAGTMEFKLLNNTSAFNPVNAASPFFPNVQPEVPVRISGFWQGRQYGLGFSYASKWPQEFPDPQWGMTRYQGTDTLSIASNINLPSAYAGEVLSDQPYVYLPFVEYYGSANGKQFSNLSRLNSKPGVGLDDQSRNKLVLETNLATAFPGDPGTGVGTSAWTTSMDPAVGGPGVYYRDTNLPSLAAGFTIECWAATGNMTAAAHLLSLWTVMGAPSNYNTGAVYPANGDGSRFYNQITTVAGINALNVDPQLQDYLGHNNLTCAGGTPHVSGQFHHYVATCQKVGSQWTINNYIDGALVATNSGSAVVVPDDAYQILWGPAIVSGGTKAILSYTIVHGAVYPTVLKPTRIAAHYDTMISGNAGELVARRVGKLAAWSGSGIPMVSMYPAPNPAFGPADQIQGTAIADELYNMVTEEGGMYYVPADSQAPVVYQSRHSLYNKAPKYVFGDNPGEVPYDPGSGFDYDDQFLFNITGSQRTVSAGTSAFVSHGRAQTAVYDAYGVDAIITDTSSQAQFFPRGPLEQDGETTSDQDAYDRAAWSLTKYKQPHLRANEIMLDPGANPAVFATALGIEQGDVVTINRRPMGGAVISLNCIVQKVSHEIGPNSWHTTVALAPYFPENAVIQLDNVSWNTPGSGALAW